MKLKLLYTKFKDDAFIKNNLIYFVGSLAVSFFNYIYYPVIGRATSISNFGEVQAVLSIVLQLGIILGVFGTAITNIVANSSEEDEKIDTILYLQKIAAITTLVLFLAITISSFWLKSFFNFSSYFPFIGLAFIIVPSVPYIIRSAYLQGEHDFKTLSIAGIMYASLKIVFSAVLLIIGLKTFGAVSGVAIAQAVGLLYLYIKTKDHIKRTKNIEKHEEEYQQSFKKQLKKELGYLFFILFIYITTSALYTSDVLIVKHFFSPEQTGLYSSISTVARIIYFVTSSVAAVLIPSVKLQRPMRENIAILTKSLMIICLIGGGTLLVFSLMPTLVIRIIMGSKFVPLAHYLPMLSLFIFLSSCVNLLFTFLIALRKYGASFIALISLAFLWLLIAFHHTSLDTIIFSFILVNFFTLVLLFVYILYNTTIAQNLWQKINLYRS